MTTPALTIQGVAQRFGVTEHVVLTWIRNGDLVAVNVARRPDGKKPRWRVTADALEGFELRRSHTPAPTPARRRKRQTDVRYY